MLMISGKIERDTFPVWETLNRTRPSVAICANEAPNRAHRGVCNGCQLRTGYSERPNSPDVVQYGASNLPAMVSNLIARSVYRSFFVRPAAEAREFGPTPRWLQSKVATPSVATEASSGIVSATDGMWFQVLRS